MIHVQTLFVLHGFSASPLHSDAVVWSPVSALAALGCASFSGAADGAEFTAGGVGAFEGSCAAIGALKSANAPTASIVHANLIVDANTVEKPSKNPGCHRRAAFIWIVAVNSVTSLTARVLGRWGGCGLARGPAVPPVSEAMSNSP